LKRKLEQVETLLVVAIHLLDKLLKKVNDKLLRVVEFCAGSGYIALPLAQLYPNIEFVIIDMKVHFKYLFLEFNYLWIYTYRKNLSLAHIEE
jgi:hypothetical protein